MRICALEVHDSASSRHCVEGQSRHMLCSVVAQRRHCVHFAAVWCVLCVQAKAKLLAEIDTYHSEKISLARMAIVRFGAKCIRNDSVVLTFA